MNAAFNIQMRIPFLLFFFVLVLGSATSCKKSCYQCNQYCSYCVNRSDSSIVYKICTNKFGDHLRIDSIEATFPDSLYICNTLNNSTNICDGPNRIDQAITYYEEEDYFCSPN